MEGGSEGMEVKHRTTRHAVLEAMHRTGELATLRSWVVDRVRSYEIQLDEQGTLGHDGVAMPANAVICMLKRDFRNAFPWHPHGIADLIIRDSLDRMVVEGMKQIANGEDGWTPPGRAHDAPIGRHGAGVREQPAP
jgi:hypothetical protein